jgi:hypothetical protein
MHDHGFSLSLCVSMSFVAYQFVSVTIVPIMELSK